MYKQIAGCLVEKQSVGMLLCEVYCCTNFRISIELVSCGIYASPLLSHVVHFIRLYPCIMCGVC